MTLQDDNTVRKSSHCAWQIHYHIVFPVKYRKVLLDEEVTKIIRETAVSIEERYPIEMEALGTDKNHIHILCSAHPKVAPGRIVQIFKSITAREIFRRQPAVKRELWGGRILVGWVLCCDGGRARQLADGRAVCPTARISQRRCPTTETLLTLRYPVSLLRGSSLTRHRFRGNSHIPSWGHCLTLHIMPSLKI